MLYPNAPIREALFDIKIDRLNIKAVEDLLAIRDDLKDDFPIEKMRHNVLGTFQITPDKPLEGKAQSNLVGYIFISKDGTRQVQIRVDGITLNVLKPYENWETHFTYLIKVWKSFSKLFQPNKIIRIETRFINRIEIPFPFNDFNDYIVNMPPIPGCLPQSYYTYRNHRTCFEWETSIYFRY